MSLPCDWCIVPENNALWLGAEVIAETRTQNNSHLTPLFPGTQVMYSIFQEDSIILLMLENQPLSILPPIFSFGQRCEKANLVCTSLVIPDDMASLHLVYSLRKSIQVYQ